MNSKRIGFASAILVSLVCFSVLAQNPVPMKNDGVPGQWFPRSMVDKIQTDLLELDALRENKIELNIKLDLRLQRIGHLRLAEQKASKAVEVCEEGLTIAESAAEEQAIRAVEAQESEAAVRAQANVWHEQPATWLGGGVLVTLIVELLVWGIVK